jgi:hypothetical protein
MSICKNLMQLVERVSLFRVIGDFKDLLGFEEVCSMLGDRYCW